MPRPTSTDAPARYTILSSSFFREQRAAALPTPSEVRAINHRTGDVRAQTPYRPTPVFLPSLGLVVKYGTAVTIHEATTQIMVREKLRGKVPVPEVFGWTTDGGQVFIYMQLVDGETLQSRWHRLDEAERTLLCSQLRAMVDCWRRLPQDDGDGGYVGSPGRRPLNDIFFMSHPELTGPYEGPDAVAKFQSLCEIDISLPMPVVFTHADLLPPNIMVSTGPRPVVTAVIDWAQAGWYPAYWEYCKLRRIGLNPDYFEPAEQEEWLRKYLLSIIDPVDTETRYYPCLKFWLSKCV